MSIKYLYHYKTQVGTFGISPDPVNSGRFHLCIDGDALGSYYSPMAAADDVYLQASGYPEWDSLEPVTSPIDLSEWTKGTPDDI